MPSAHFDCVLGSATKIDTDGENRRFSTLKFKSAKAKAGNKFLPFGYQFLFCLRLCLNVTAFLLYGRLADNKLRLSLAVNEIGGNDDLFNVCAGGNVVHKRKHLFL